MSWSQKQRAKIIAKTYAKLGLYKKKVLDIGCGNGEVSKVIIKILEINIIGCDIENYCNETIPFKQMENITQLPFGDNSFDAVMLNDVLHHCDNIEELLISASKIAPEIYIFEDKESFLLKLLDVGLNHFYCKNMNIPLNFKTEEQWENLFKKLGFLTEKTELNYPFWYPIRHFAFKLVKKESQ